MSNYPLASNTWDWQELKAIKSVIKGDQKISCISAASIIAKVTRDKMVTKLGQKFKIYNSTPNPFLRESRETIHFFY